MANIAQAEGDEAAIYRIGVDKDNGDTDDVSIFENNTPIAVLCALEAQVGKLVHAGNCFEPICEALREILHLFKIKAPAADARWSIAIVAANAALAEAEYR